MTQTQQQWLETLSEHTHNFTAHDDVKWYRGALEAIANMRVTQETDFKQLAALCIAVAKLALGQPQKAEP